MEIPTELVDHPYVRECQVNLHVGDVVCGDITPLERAGYLVCCAPSHQEGQEFLDLYRNSVRVKVEPIAVEQEELRGR